MKDFDVISEANSTFDDMVERYGEVVAMAASFICNCAARHAMYDLEQLCYDENRSTPPRAGGHYEYNIPRETFSDHYLAHVLFSFLGSGNRFSRALMEQIRDGVKSRKDKNIH